MVSIPVYYFSEDPSHMTKAVPHPFRAVVDPHHFIDESTESNNKSDIMYLDPGNICSKMSSIRGRSVSAFTGIEVQDVSAPFD